MIPALTDCEEVGYGSSFHHAEVPLEHQHFRLSRVVILIAFARADQLYAGTTPVPGRAEQPGGHVVELPQQRASIPAMIAATQASGLGVSSTSIAQHSPG